MDSYRQELMKKSRAELKEYMISTLLQQFDAIGKGEIHVSTLSDNNRFFLDTLEHQRKELTGWLDHYFNVQNKSLEMFYDHMNNRMERLEALTKDLIRDNLKS